MSKFWQKSRSVARLFLRWGAMALGRSYWHVPQGLGKEFYPGKLAGYFNDLTRKVNWSGPVDRQGFPLNKVKGNHVYFATTLFQKALGHWDIWLGSRLKDQYSQYQFLNLARWAVENQDEQGGWPIWPLLGLWYPSPYSAMTQGEGVSVLVRAYWLTNDDAYLGAARRAIGPMQKEVRDGGVCRVVSQGIILEEAPSETSRGILNGWVFALFGLYDFLLVKEDKEVRNLLEKTLNALVAHLPFYNAGYWSYYDLSGHLASPFYHRLHIAHLQALALAFPNHANDFRRFEETFTRQLANPMGKIRALVVKSAQKLRNLPQEVLE